MNKILYPSFITTLILAFICCGLYPLAVTGLGQLLFHSQANGSLILKDGKPVGSRLIGQAFSKPEYFHGRPSAAGSGYDAASSSGSNLGPTNLKFADTLKANAEKVLKNNPSLKKGEIPVDLVTASASGLDPHISPEGAYAQVERVAKARGKSVDEMRERVRASIEPSQWGLLGEPVVNVLQLNLTLDQLNKRNE